MSTRPAMLTVFGPWKGRPDRNALEQAMATALPAVTEAPFQIRRTETLLLVDLLDLPGLLATINLGCRGHEWRLGVCLRTPPNPTMAAIRTIRFARPSPWGVAVRRDRTDPRVPTVSAALALHVSLLRQRTPAMWRAIDAVRTYGNGTNAANALGCSPQAVSRHLRQGHAEATGRTGLLLSTLFAVGEQENVS